MAGFVGYNARKACSRCLKPFPRVGDHTDLGLVEIPGQSVVMPFIVNMHVRDYLLEQEARKLLERQFGARYSLLFELPYYDAIRFTVIDPMQKLYL